MSHDYAKNTNYKEIRYIIRPATVWIVVVLIAIITTLYINYSKQKNNNAKTRNLKTNIQG